MVDNPPIALPDGTSVGVVGAGTIGRGVAQRIAEAGLSVRLVDTDRAALSAARSEISAAARAARLFKRGDRLSPGDPLERIAFETGLKCLERTDFVIENITERLDLKLALYPRLGEICPAGSIFIANSSAIPIGVLAAASGRPEQFIGVHFMNPVPLISMVELIPGPETNKATEAATGALLARLGLEWVAVKDGVGYLSNRVLMLMINEAIILHDAGVASAADIDRLFRGCFGHRMGPLETADLIGLDTVLLTLEVLKDGLGAPKFSPATGLKRRVEQGHLGRKTKRGFHCYGAAPYPRNLISES
jgi:3-hydroxybutyryl-CoA dehydrogenase